MNGLNNWQIALIALQVFGALAYIAMIGKERKPTTPADAVGVLLLSGLVVYMVVRA